MVSWPEYSKQAKTIRYACDLVQAIAFVISNEENRDIAMATDHSPAIADAHDRFANETDRPLCWRGRHRVAA